MRPRLAWLAALLLAGGSALAAGTQPPDALESAKTALRTRDYPGALAKLQRDAAGGMPIDQAAMIEVRGGGADAADQSDMHRMTVAHPGCLINVPPAGGGRQHGAAGIGDGENDLQRIVVDPADYASLLAELDAEGILSAGTRFALARKAFSHTAAYDGAISNWVNF